MPQRTDYESVRAALGGDYDAVSQPSLDPAIRPASMLVDDLESSGYTPGAARLAEIETWLAAYWYTKSDPIYSSRSTSGASGSFVRDGKRPNPYLAAALELDASGLLAGLLDKGSSVGGAWLGTYPTDRPPWPSRR